MSDPNAVDSQIMMLLGAPGSGKTAQAGTLSPEFNAALKAGKPSAKRIDASRARWQQADKGGSDTLRTFNIYPAVDLLPTDFTRDLDIYSSEDPATKKRALMNNIFSTMQDVMQNVGKLRQDVADGKVDYFVLDSLTTFANSITYACLLPELFVQGFDKWAGYRVANGMFRNYLDALTAIPCPQVWLCHTRTAWTEAAKELKERDARTDVEQEVVVDVQDGIRKLLQGRPSLVAGTYAESKKGSPAKYIMTVQPDGTFNTKNRWVIPSQLKGTETLGDIFNMRAK